jgi:hypothetical protein
MRAVELANLTDCRRIFKDIVEKGEMTRCERGRTQQNQVEPNHDNETQNCLMLGQEGKDYLDRIWNN